MRKASAKRLATASGELSTIALFCSPSQACGQQPVLDSTVKHGFNSAMNQLVERAAAIVGSQVELASRLGVSVQAVNQVVNGVRPLPARWAIPIEKATEGAVTRYELCPDVFGAPEESRSPLKQ